MQLSKLEGRLSQVQIEKEEASQQCAAERRRAVAAESQGQQRLVGALRRLEYLVRDVSWHCLGVLLDSTLAQSQPFAFVSLHFCKLHTTCQ